MLKKILEAREARWNHRLKLVEEYSRPLLTFILNIPGSNKTGDVFLDAHKRVLEELKELLKLRQIPVIHLERRIGHDGPEGFLVLDLPAEKIKELALGFEESHSMGRIMDLDVMDANGTCLSREQFGLSPRKCILCDAPARECIVLRRHEKEEVIERVVEIVNNYLNECPE